MKRKLLLLLFLVLLFAGFIGFRYFVLSSQDVYGKLRVVSSPSATVFIDNIAMGKTPYEEKAKVGSFLIKLIPEATASPTASWQGKIKVYKNALSFINRELGTSDIESAGEIFTVSKMEKTKNANMGEIYVETEPNGAIIYLDNDEKGVASVVLADVMKGDHELSVFMPGFLRRTQKIKVDAGYRVNASFKLAVDPSAKPTTSLAPTNGQSTQSAMLKKTTVTIRDTQIGYLRVRGEPSVSASEAGRVKPGETFDLVEEKEGWYKIQFDKNKLGWIYAQYADKQEGK